MYSLLSIPMLTNSIRHCNSILLLFLFDRCAACANGGVTQTQETFLSIPITMYRDKLCFQFYNLSNNPLVRRLKNWVLSL